MTTPTPIPKRPSLTISHVVLHCFEIDKMADFYSRVMGLNMTDQKVIGPSPWEGARLIFFSSDPRDHHQLALADGRTAEKGTVLLHQVSYRHDSLDRLRTLLETLNSEGITGIMTVDHGFSWSLYFNDPEGNMIEAFVETPWYVEPIYDELDLSLSDEEILRVTEERIKDAPEFKPFSQWRAEFAEKFGLETPGQ